MTEHRAQVAMLPTGGFYGMCTCKWVGGPRHFTLEAAIDALLHDPDYQPRLSEPQAPDLRTTTEKARDFQASLDRASEERKASVDRLFEEFRAKPPEARVEHPESVLRFLEELEERINAPRDS